MVAVEKVSLGISPKEKGVQPRGGAAEPPVFRYAIQIRKTGKHPAREPVVNHARFQTSIPDKHG